MGRSPDYKASLMNTLGANYAFYEKFADNAKSWYRRAQEKGLSLSTLTQRAPAIRASSKPCRT